jgi:hypothetical protein
MTSIRVYLIIATCMTGLSVGGNTARAQSRASLTTDPGAGATLTAEIDVVLATGPVSDTDTQTTNVTGSSVATLLPTDRRSIMRSCTPWTSLAARSRLIFA